jgi:hypothetical protein
VSQRLESAASTRRLTPMKHQGHMRSDTTSTTTGFCIASEWLCLALVSAFARPASGSRADAGGVLKAIVTELRGRSVRLLFFFFFLVKRGFCDVRLIVTCRRALGCEWGGC